MNTHLRNRFQTAIATAANTPGLHNNRIIAVRNRLREIGLHARRPYVGCVLTQRHLQNRNWAGISFFFRMNQDFLYNVVMAGCACTVGEMNDMLTGVFLNEIIFWGGGYVIAHGYRSPLVLIGGNLNAQRYRDDILAHHVILLFHNNANIAIFHHDDATSHTARDTVKKILGQITFISLMTGPLTVLI